MPSPQESQHYCSRCLTTLVGDPQQCANLGCLGWRPAEGWGTIIQPGQVFDRAYRVHRMLAVGGAGVTYLARELDGDGEETGPPVAIKVLLAARDQGPYLRRLATEAQIIQELDHPNIVEYRGFVHRTGHSPYLITHFEAGGSLLDHMRRVGTLSVQEAAVIGRQICGALAQGHSKGIVHRDLKPENVLLAEEVPRGQHPVVRVADFGIAKVTGSIGGGMTRVGAFVGTPMYAAPEQFVGGAVSQAADVYGVGALLYFCMMARHVVDFSGGFDPEDTFQRLCDTLPPQLRRDQDPQQDVERMNQVLALAMAIDPEHRCTVEQLDQMLSEVVEGSELSFTVDDVKTKDVSEPVATLQAQQTLAAESQPDGSAPDGPQPAATADASLGPASHTPPPEPLVSVSEPESSGPDRSGSTLDGGADDAEAERPSRLAALGKFGCGCLVLVLVALIAAAVAVFGAGWAFVADLVGGEPAAPEVIEETVDAEVAGATEAAPLRLLSAASASEPEQRDFAAIRASADQLRPTLTKQCSPAVGDSATVHLVVGADGSVGEVTPRRGATSECVARQLTGARLARQGDEPALVELSWSW